MTLALPTTARPPRDRSVVLLLARMEAKRMLLHPAFLAGLGASVAVAWRAVVTDADADWTGAGYQATLIAWAFAALGTLVTAALAAGRGRLLEDVDLFEGVPLPPSRRILALVAALVGPVTAVAIAVAAVAALVASRGGFLQADPLYGEDLFPVPLLEWVHLPIVALLGGITGILVASLPKARALILVVVTAFGLLSSVIYWVFWSMPLRAIYPVMLATSAEPLPATFSPTSWSGRGGLLRPDEFNARWREVRGHEAFLQWHVVGLLGLCLLGVALAVRLVDPDERRARPLIALGGLIALGAVAAQLSVGL